MVDPESVAITNSRSEDRPSIGRVPGAAAELLWQDANRIATGNHALRPVLSFRPEARPYHGLSTGEVLLALLPELAPEAVNVRKLYQVFSTNDFGAAERVLRCAAKREALSEEGAHVQLRVGSRFTSQNAGVILA